VWPRPFGAGGLSRGAGATGVACVLQACRIRKRRGFRFVPLDRTVRQLSPVRPYQTPQVVGVWRALSSFRTAAAELPTLSIARANSSLVTPRCRVQYLIWSSCSKTILLRSGVILLIIFFAGLAVQEGNGVASVSFRLTGRRGNRASRHGLQYEPAYDRCDFHYLDSAAVCTG
jgi:hypothetical protein